MQEKLEKIGFTLYNRSEIAIHYNWIDRQQMKAIGPKWMFWHKSIFEKSGWLVEDSRLTQIENFLQKEGKK